jgi:hypothetical protein
MKRKKTIEDIAVQFKKNMQKISDKDGVTVSISSPSFNNGKEIVIAEPKEKPCRHKERKMGYIEWALYMEMRYGRGDRQKQCPKCKRWFYNDEM